MTKLIVLNPGHRRNPSMTEPTLDRRMLLGGVALAGAVAATAATAQPAPAARLHAAAPALRP